MRLALRILAATLLIATTIGCSSQSRFIRNNPVIRYLYYPPKVENMERGLGRNTEGGSFDHSAYARLLSEYVNDDGVVNYVGLETKRAELDAYLDSVAAADRSMLSRYDDLALLLNAYNACTLALILDFPGIDSIQDIPKDKRWRNPRWVVGGEQLCLYRLEHGIIRPEFTEPLIHFALVCAARGCPKLRNEPYEGDRLLEQLVDQAQHFLAQSENLAIDLQSRELFLSELFDWYKGDFTAGDVELRDWGARYGPRPLHRQITTLHRRIDIKYVEYDWGLNGPWR